MPAPVQSVIDPPVIFGAAYLHTKIGAPEPVVDRPAHRRRVQVGERPGHMRAGEVDHVVDRVQRVEQRRDRALVGHVERERANPVPELVTARSPVVLVATDDRHPGAGLLSPPSGRQPDPGAPADDDHRRVPQ